MSATIIDDQTPRSEPAVKESRGRRPHPIVTVGWLAIGLGLVLIVFAVYQLWGTGLVEGQAQRSLSEELAAEIAHHQAVRDRASARTEGNDGEADDTDGTDHADDGVAMAAVPADPPPTPGAPIARLLIDRIDLDKTVVEGVGRVQLRTGPGHYPDTPLPGHVGHVAIAGHRTTYGAPFGDLDRLEPGDLIEVETVEGRFRYRVEAQVDADGSRSGHRIVAYDDVSVVRDRGDNRLTLTSCHPRYSDRQRLVVTAVLVGDPVDVVDHGAPTEIPAEAASADPGSRFAVPASGGPVGEEGPGSSAGPTLGWQWEHLDAVAVRLALVLACMYGLMAGLRRRHRLLSALAGLVAIVLLINAVLWLEKVVPAL